MNLLKEQLEAVNKNKKFALVTIVATTGVTPRGMGSKMIVYEDGSTVGTIGGGVLEKQALKDSLFAIENKLSELKTYENKSSEPGAVCGGSITVYIENHTPLPELVVCGAGHVGSAVVNLAKTLNYNVIVLDTRREDFIKENSKLADKLILIDDFYNGIKNLDISSNSFFLVSTFGHKEDKDTLSAILEKKPKYVGMLGSKIKIKNVVNSLLENGFSQEDIDFVHMPIGLDIGGETPIEIAFSIMSEIQKVRYDKTGISIKDLL